MYYRPVNLGMLWVKACPQNMSIFGVDVSQTKAWAAVRLGRVEVKFIRMPQLCPTSLGLAPLPLSDCRATLP